LVRHGQSTANAGLQTSNHSEVGLTQAGVQQAHQVAQQITRCPALIIVSSFERARLTARPLLARYPEVRCETWPIEEFTYLSVPACANTTAATRQPMVEHYWTLADPGYVDGPGAEAFASFVGRVRAFHSRLLTLKVDGEVVVIGHGQFFRAFLLLLEQRLHPTPEGMKCFRAAETTSPIANGEIIKLALRAIAPSACANTITRHEQS
jgi:2,3-bisphosphoglycerate-dependent phosphoglycerate mutase